MQTTAPIPDHYRTAFRTLVRFAAVMAVLAILSGIAFQESTRKLGYDEVPAGMRLEAVIDLALVHGHFFTLGVILPLVLGGALLVARKAGGADLTSRALAWLTRVYLPFSALTVVLLLAKGYHVLLAVRAGERDFAAIGGLFPGAAHYAVYGVVHGGMGLGLLVFLAALWRSLGRGAAGA